MTAPTTSARKGSLIRSPLAIAIALFALIVAVLILTRPPTYAHGSLADPQNPDPDGAMAVAEILRNQGVKVNVVRSVSSALASSSDALVITSPNLLSQEQLVALSGLTRDTILLEVRSRVAGFLPDLRSEPGPRSVIDAGCEDPRAQAGPIRTSSALFSSPGAQTCFPGGESGTMLTVTHPEGFRVTVLPYDVLKNVNLTEESNAALALRVLGEHSSITWLVASHNDAYPDQTSDTDLGLGWFFAPLIVMFIAITWWRAPRFGPLSTEPLPVVVHASETTVGRGRLYQGAKDLAHAATSLRLGALEQISPRIGLPAGAGRGDVVTAVATAVSASESDIALLLYGPPPTTTPSLHALALSLDALVDEVEHS